MDKSRQLLLGLITLTSSSIALAQLPKIAESWTGRYNNEQKISLFFKQTGKIITGYSLLNGQKTEFKGKIEPTDLNYTVTLNEIGQGDSIGKFVLDYNSNTSKIDAQWTSSSQKIKPKFFTLDAQQCKYAKSEGNFPEASSRLLKDVDLQIPLYELQYMRNEIYARHGYAFKSKDWARDFSFSDWYMPCYTDTEIEAQLTDIEKKNVKRIKMVEPYAVKADWGR